MVCHRPRHPARRAGARLDADVDEAATAFDPKVNGFHFVNSFSGLDIVTELGAGFLGGDLPSSVVPDDFWDRWGLCGGMSWHALDRYYAEWAMRRLAKRNANYRLAAKIVSIQIDTTNVLFILGGAFAGLESIIEQPHADDLLTTVVRGQPRQPVDHPLGTLLPSQATVMLPS